MRAGARLVIAAALLVASCTGSGDESLVSTAAETPPAATSVPPPTALPTTVPVAEASTAGPTPVDLGARAARFVVPEAQTDAMDAGEAGAAENQATAGQTAVPGDEPADTGADGAAAPTPAREPTAVTAASPTSAPAEVPTPAPTDATGLDVAATNGAEVYLASCARCHGPNGEGSLFSSLVGVSQRYSHPTLVEELTNGHAFTFGFRTTLSASEINDVAAFVLARLG